MTTSSATGDEQITKAEVIEIMNLNLFGQR